MKKISELTELEINIMLCFIFKMEIENINEHGLIGNVIYVKTKDGLEMFDFFTNNAVVKTTRGKGMDRSTVKRYLIELFSEIYGLNLPDKYDSVFTFDNNINHTFTDLKLKTALTAQYRK